MYDDKTKKIIDVLKSVKDPETGSNIVDMGLVYGLDVNDKGIRVWMSFSSSTPSCWFCKTIAWSIINKISTDIVERLKKSGFESVKVVDALSPKIVYLEES